MTKKAVPTYNPQLDPQRKILAEKHEMLPHVIGTRGLTRWGEQYIATCVCVAYVVTSDSTEAHSFMTRHEGCER